MKYVVPALVASMYLREEFWQTAVQRFGTAALAAPKLFSYAERSDLPVMPVAFIVQDYYPEPWMAPRLKFAKDELAKRRTVWALLRPWERAAYEEYMHSIHGIAVFAADVALMAKLHRTRREYEAQQLCRRVLFHSL